ncbi:MAG: L-threonylcarbamoyladenylate synthase [Nanoarchaeota archaeon]
METITPDEFIVNKHRFFQHLRDGALFIYPTDTIYGIGCDATNEKAVQRLRKLKEQTTRPFSVLAPSKDWIHQHCETKGNEGWLRKLPGPMTLIFKLKDKTCIAPSVNLGNGTLGVRLVSHPAQKIVEELGRPIITTSANVTGRNFMTSAEDIDSKIRNGMDFLIYEGEKPGKASDIINLTGQKPSIRKR